MANFLFEKWGLFIGRVLVCAYNIWWYVQILISSQFQEDHLSQSIGSSLLLLLRLFVAFAYEVINGFISFSA